jgi:arylsulfatase A-like enzyme
VDLAPTILELAGVPVPLTLEGVGFAERLRGSGGPEEAVFLEWAGDRTIPAWEAVRTAGAKLIRYADGTEELYDLAGVAGEPDPWEASNRVGDPAYADLLRDLRTLLGRHPGRR